MGKIKIKTREQLKQDFIEIVREANEPQGFTEDVGALFWRMDTIRGKVARWKSELVIWVTNGDAQKALELTYQYTLKENRKAIDLYHEHIDREPITITTTEKQQKQ